MYQYKIIANQGMYDRKQLFFGLNQAICFSNLVEEIKQVSNHSINDKGFMNGKFSWQDVYGTFFYGKSPVERLYKSVLNQKKHAKKQPFKTAYTSLLKLFVIEFKDEYLFEFYD